MVKKDNDIKESQESSVVEDDDVKGISKDQGQEKNVTCDLFYDKLKHGLTVLRYSTLNFTETPA